MNWRKDRNLERKAQINGRKFSLRIKSNSTKIIDKKSMNSLKRSKEQEDCQSIALTELRYNWIAIIRMLRNHLRKISKIHLNISQLKRTTQLSHSSMLYLRLKLMRCKMLWLRIKTQWKIERREYGIRQRKIMFSRKINKINTLNKRRVKRHMNNGRKSLSFIFLKQVMSKMKEK